MTDMTFVWANAAVLLAAASYVRVRLFLIAHAQQPPRLVPDETRARVA